MTRLQIPTTSSKFLKLLTPWRDNKPPLKYSLGCSLTGQLHWLNPRPAGHQVKRHRRATNTLTLHEYSTAWREVQRGNVTHWHAAWQRSPNPSSLALRSFHFKQFSSCVNEFARQPKWGFCTGHPQSRSLGCYPWRTTTLGLVRSGPHRLPGPIPPLYIVYVSLMPIE